MVIHVLKDGTKVSSVKDRVVKQKDVPQIYALMEQMNSRRKKK